MTTIKDRLAKRIEAEIKKYVEPPLGKAIGWGVTPADLADAVLDELGLEPDDELRTVTLNRFEREHADEWIHDWLVSFDDGEYQLVKVREGVQE